MTERCDLRSFETAPYSDVDEPTLPQKCIDCIHKALSLGLAERRIETIDKPAQKELQAYYGLHDDIDQVSRWELKTMDVPGDDAGRTAKIAVGFDVDTHSYIEGTVYQTQTITFKCPDD